ncbi:Mu DNA-binding domain-containing protein [Tistlia consotensis]|uniref:Mu DNA-binding domain-containing protein n=1 Tax=Tistlia consotensis USBA 355 TaxID=560819 RepID=A0A1Y6C8G4_9PROT|nr:DNA-binding protein [Tistlia consotensis]SMF41970.1 Mu DNA-binding domain-containing protein [Tistlia consotensis USBA 355]SMF66263.1 Mu DNA-binding domain-containing protein [Tistlia consotensis USBA 355]SNR73157.1 Mu DNA-binding domain-containing protein [Tistlia consotensis]
MRDNDFPLTVTVGADEWAYVNRRMHFLEAVVIQVLRHKAGLKEWFSAAELAALGLPGLPATRQGINRAARQRGWRFREVPARSGFRCEYHVTTLPAAAFDDLVKRIVTERRQVAPIAGTAPSLPAGPAVAPAPSRTAPQWVLPLMRMLKRREASTLEAAVERLADRLPPDVRCPSYAEARETLAALGIGLPA